MLHGTRSPARLAAGLACAAALALAAAAALAQPPRGGAKAPPPRPQFKNLKVLRDVPADQIIPLMHAYSASLGVQCDHCHVVETNAAGQHVGWEKDTRPQKETARKMITMTRDLNAHQKILDGKASCFMCHHGRAEPETKVVVPPPPGAPPRR
jgi:hypothetical protein